jgi:hypothetical protein
MTNELSKKNFKHLIVLGIILTIFLVSLDRIALNFKEEDEKNQIILQSLESNKILSDELNSLLLRLKNDFNFFEKEILTLINLKPDSLKYQTKIQSLINFLEMH